MLIKKFNFSSLAVIDTKTITITDPNGMIISDYMDATRSYESTLQFSVKTGENQVPFLKETSFAISIRERVDLSATGPHDRTIADEDKDIGKHNYSDASPYPPRNLVDGFIELKGE